MQNLTLHFSENCDLSTEVKSTIAIADVTLFNSILRSDYDRKLHRKCNTKKSTYFCWVVLDFFFR